MKNILFPTLGSAGDVAPLLVLSQALNQRGYRLVIIASPVFQNIARQSNVDFVALGTEQNFADMLNNPDLWHPTRGFSVIVKQGILPFIRPLLNIIRSFEPKDTLVVSPLLLFGSHLAHEKDQTPFITLQLQPSLLRSAYSPPVLGGSEIPSWVPPALVRQYYKILDKTLIDPQLAPAINAFRAELGLAPVQRVFDRFLFSPMKNICLFPDWYAQPQIDWPPNTIQTGFIASQNQPQPLSEELQTFLENGEKPLVFTAGTAMQHGSDFYQTAVKATQMLGKRAVLVTGQSNQIPENLPKTIIHQTFADFSLLLPQAALFIYHGGIGSLAQATAAGIPQLIMPMSQDQPDNAARIRRLGLGDSISPRQFTPAKVARKMESLLSNQDLQANCHRFAQKINFQEALEKTRNEIESCL